jgi:hypothetical protein
MELMGCGIGYGTCAFPNGFNADLVDGKPVFDEASIGHEGGNLSLHKAQGRFREPAPVRGEFISWELCVHQFERIQHPARAVAVL